MKLKSIFLVNITCLLLFLSLNINAQNSPIGIWKTVDDVSGEAKSYVKIYEKNGKLYGNIDKLLVEDPSTTCEKCPGDKKDQLLVGMEILWDLEPHKDYWSNGKVLDPESGKIYKGSVWLEDGNLNLRGYIGISLLGRTQTWFRVE